MGRYVLKRLAAALPLLLAIATVGFLLIHLIPGDPARAQLGARGTPAQVRALDHQYGLDQPWPTQYWHFLRNAAMLDFGQSYRLHQSVTAALGARAVPTLLLALYGLVVAVIVAVPLAFVAARREDRWADHAIRVVGMTFYAMPPFWLGLMLAVGLGLRLGWFPTSGYDSSGPLAVLHSLALPALTLSLILAPLFVRTLRAGVIATYRAAFIESARARGLSERRILWRHAFRNSSISLVTVIGLVAGFVVSGTVVIESVFAIPGLGQLLVNSVASRDFPVIQGLTVIFASAVVLINLLTDVVYAIVDPRVRL